MIDICCIGHITKDKIITPGFTTYISGGTAYYFSWGIKYLPSDVSYRLITKVGKDHTSEINNMVEAGIDVINKCSAETVFFENIYGYDFNSRTQRVLSKADAFNINDIRDTEAKIFHLGSLLSDDFSLDFIRSLSEKGRISIDAQGFLRCVKGEKVVPVDWYDKKEAMRYVDIIKINEYEMELITGYKDARLAAKQLAEWGAKEIVITLGSYGSVLYSRGQFFDIPAMVDGQVVDVTGCGDTYSTGYLYCRAKGENVKSSGEFAAAMCALKMKNKGAFSGNIHDIENIKSKFT